MDDERYIFIEKNLGEKLTDEELKEGWHFCYDWDGMLVGPGMSAMDSCLCEISKEEICGN